MRCYEAKKKKRSMKIVTINLPRKYLEAITKICKIQRRLYYEGYTVPDDIDFPSRSEFVRVAVREALDKYLNFYNKIAGFNAENLENLLEPVEQYLKENGLRIVRRLD